MSLGVTLISAAISGAALPRGAALVHPVFGRAPQTAKLARVVDVTTINLPRWHERSMPDERACLPEPSICAEI
jgi:hypothetical protein